jgi:ABC-2 type transport system ATP-binding protein
MSIIRVENLVKRFGDFTAVKGVSFDVKAGEIFAFLGPNGAGKSTTISMLTTLVPKTSGEIEVNGFDPEKDSFGVRKSFGIVFQDDSHDEDLTAYENMALHATLYGVPKHEREEKIKNFLEYVDLWDRKDDQMRKFSGGMKRRLEIARALLHEPKILFLDEPTLGLDPQTRNYLWNYVHKLSKERGMTIFFTTHYMEEAERYASRIAIIDHGEIKSIGTLEELKQKTGTTRLEEAFLKITGEAIREEGGEDIMKKARALHTRR